MSIGFCPECRTGVSKPSKRGCLSNILTQNLRCYNLEIYSVTCFLGHSVLASFHWHLGIPQSSKGVIELFMTNIKSQFCHTVFLEVFGQCLDLSGLIGSAIRFAQGCLHWEWTRSSRTHRVRGAQTKLPWVRSRSTGVGTQHVYTEKGRYHLAFFPHLFGYSQRNGKAYYTDMSWWYKGTQSMLLERQSVGVTLSVLQKSIVNWGEMVFSSYFFFFPTWLGLNKN